MKQVELIVLIFMTLINIIIGKIINIMNLIKILNNQKIEKIISMNFIKVQVVQVKLILI